MSRKHRLVLCATALIVLAASVLLLPRYRYRSIVIHHTASGVDDYGSIREQHRARGWGDAAYHLILSNGSAGVPAGHLESTGRYRGGKWSTATQSRWHNATALHLCVVGNYDEAPFPESLRPALASAIREIQWRYSIDRDALVLHRDCNNTACPGRHLDRATISDWLGLAVTAPAEIRSQHNAVIAATDLVLGRPTTPVLRAAGTAALAIVLLFRPWRGARRRSRRRRKRRAR